MVRPTPSKSQTDEPLFKKGNLVRLHLKDFMTYKDITLTAGPNLNLVLGPNGTGKSALVCGIIIGLGGEPSNTGRAGHLGEYIRFGCTSATVDIELYNDIPNAKNYLIQRTIHSKTNANGKVDYSTTFKLNGKDANRTKVREFIHSININVDNLCQFLPQERVVEFVKMDRKTLLECTEKAAGDEDMYESHQQIVVLSKEMKKLNEGNAQLTNQINTETEIQTRAEEELRRLQERDKYKEKISWLKKKRPWIEYEDKRVEYEEAKKEYIEKKQEVQTVMQSLEPLKLVVNNSRTQLTKCQTNKTNALSELKKASKGIEPIKSEIEATFDKVKDVKTNFYEQMDCENRRRARQKELETNLHNMNERYENVGEEGQGLEPQIKEVVRQMSEVNDEIGAATKNKMIVQENLEKIVIQANKLDYKKRTLEDVFQRRLSKLRELDAKAAKAYEWLHKNENRFRAKIYPPIVTQIDVKKIEWAKYVEASVKRADLSAFICEDRDDLKLFTQSIKDELNLRLNVVSAPIQDADNFEPNFDINDYKPYGIYATVKDMFTAPNKVMAYLCKSSFLHQIPVGNQTTDQKFDVFLKDKSNFRRVFSLSSAYTINTSRYDNKKVVSRDTCPDSRFLNITGNERELQQIRQQLKEFDQKKSEVQTEGKQVEQKLAALNEKQSELKNRKKMLDDKKNEKRILETKILQLKEQIQRIRDTAKDTDEMRRKCEDVLKKYEEKMLRLMNDLVNRSAECVALNNSKAKALLAETLAKKSVDQAQRKLSLASEQFQELKDGLKRSEELLAELKREAKKLRDSAKDRSGFDVNECSDEIREIFDSLPNAIDDIDNEIGTLRLKVNSILDADDTVKDSYNARQKTIDRQRKDLESRKKELAIKLSKLEDLKSRWIPTLEDLISKINDSFSNFMARINCAGEVSLYRPEEQDAFDEYGISIKVKFRQSEPLRELTSFHQSGGERSVSTMIYMIALQELTKVPFRCVDEINQGMDENNERSVFELISETSSQNNSQYFLFSPKLLSGLDYTSKMKFHIIFNGPYMELDWSRVLSDIAADESDADTDEED